MQFNKLDVYFVFSPFLSFLYIDTNSGPLIFLPLILLILLGIQRSWQLNLKFWPNLLLNFKSFFTMWTRSWHLFELSLMGHHRELSVLGFHIHKVHRCLWMACVTQGEEKPSAKSMLSYAAQELCCRLCSDIFWFVFLEHRVDDDWVYPVYSVTVSKSFVVHNSCLHARSSDLFMGINSHHKHKEVISNAHSKHF